MKKKTNKGLLALVIVLIVVLLAVLAIVIFAPNSDSINSYTEATAKKTDIYQYILGTGSIKPNEVSTTFSQFAGAVKEIYVSEGDYVKKDDPILMVSNYKIKSPISGEVTAINYEIDEQVGLGTGLFVVTDYSSYQLSVAINENKIAKISLNDQVNIVVNALTDEKFTGYVKKINKDGVYSGGVTVYNVDIGFDTATDFKNIRNGMSTEVRVVVGKEIDVLSIPIDALYYDVNMPYVLVKDGDKLVKKDVTIGIADGTNVQIISGLNSGDSVYYKIEKSQGMMGMFMPF